MNDAPKKILVLYWHHDPKVQIRLAILQHLHALDTKDFNYKIIYYNARDGVPAWLKHVNFDALILHTTFLCLRWFNSFYAFKWGLRWIRDLDCIKIAMPQDEYDHSEILDEWLYEWRVPVIFTCFDESHRQILYPLMHQRAHFYKCFTGYMDVITAKEIQSRLLPTAERPIDIVYRATQLPYWFGSHGQIKHRIGEVVGERASAHGLKCDISTRYEDTIVGSSWLDFMASGRAVIGCESGSSVLDRRGEVKAQIQAMLLHKNPGLSFEEVSRVLPRGWDDFKFFAISPRHLEAVITKTCQILVEGSYDGVLEADKHYIPLKPDFSNLDEALEKVRDHRYIQAMVDCAYQEVFLNGKNTYQQFGVEIHAAITSHQSTSRPHFPGFMDRFLWHLGLVAARRLDTRLN